MADAGPWETVQEINKAWRTGDEAGIAERFHPDAVMVHPGFAERSEGRDVCVQSYVDFAGKATIRRLDESDVQVDVVGDTAVVSYRFEIDYEMEGDPYLDTGIDLFVLNRSDGNWQAIWRTLVMEG